MKELYGIGLLVLVVVGVMMATAYMQKGSLFGSSRKPTGFPTVQPAVISTAFNETGNLTSSAGYWTLVYEKPGQPALTMRLIFTAQSECQEQICANIPLKDGDRVKIEGIKEAGNPPAVKVVKLTK